MSIALQGLDSKLKFTTISIFTPSRHPLIRLGNAVNWEKLGALALEDLKNTTHKRFWWLGRKLQLRTHLGVYILQCLLKQTDRGIESAIRDTPVYQLFCGRSVVPQWKCPDHTKIEEFRNRLTPETHQKMGVLVKKIAQDLGFADPSWMDVDSTVQEANMAYPSDATLLKKLSEKANKVLEYLKQYFPNELSMNIGKIRKKSQEYFFLAQNVSTEIKRRSFASFHG